MTLDTQPCPKCNTEMFAGARFCVRCGARMDASGTATRPVSVVAEESASPKAALADIFVKELKPRSRPELPAATVEEIDEGFETIEHVEDAPSIAAKPGARAAEAVP